MSCKSIYFYALLVVISVWSCEDDDYEDIPVDENVEVHLSSEHLGVNASSANAFGFEIDGLSDIEVGKFAVGNSLFNQSWVASPASTTGRDGLGPTFNGRACTNCHFKDGRGKSHEGIKNSSGFLLRISSGGVDNYGFPTPVPGYGTQIQDQANNGIPYELKVNISYTYISGSYPDGTSFELRKPAYNLEQFQFGLFSPIEFSGRVGQQTIGMGLISALPPEEILKYEDVNDADGDGISGKANYVYNEITKSNTLGKYGWKANVPSLRLQVASALHGDMGLTTSIFRENNCPPGQEDCNTAATGGEPEVSDEQLDKMVFYQSTLAVPNRRNYDDPDVIKGKSIFNSLNCVACHKVDQMTSNDFEISQLRAVKIRPYSDFLLHDMGEGLADNRPEFLANGREWRTQPLWGLGLIPTVNKHSFLLHDGRARSLEEAILWHGGEADKSKSDFMSLPKSSRDQLIKFLKSL